MIRYLAFGGTIASVRRAGAAEVSPTLTGAEVLESVPELAEVAEIEVVDFPPIASFAVTPRDMVGLARSAAEAFAAGLRRGRDHPWHRHDRGDGLHARADAAAWASDRRSRARCGTRRSRAPTARRT